MTQLEQDKLLIKTLFSQESAATVAELEAGGIAILQQTLGCSTGQATTALHGLRARKLITQQAITGGKLDTRKVMPKPAWMWGKPIDD